MKGDTRVELWAVQNPAFFTKTQNISAAITAFLAVLPLCLSLFSPSTVQKSNTQNCWSALWPIHIISVHQHGGTYVNYSQTDVTPC